MRNTLQAGSVCVCVLGEVVVLHFFCSVLISALNNEVVLNG